MFSRATTEIQTELVPTEFVPHAKSAPSQQPEQRPSAANPLARLLSSETLRSRLIVAFVAVALLPFLAISFVLLLSQAQSGRQETVNQLQTVMSYKASALRNWTSTLKADLGNALLGEDVLEEARLVIRTSPASPEYQQVREIYNKIRGRFLILVDQSPYYEELFLLNEAGVVVLSTNNTQEGQVYDYKSFFQGGLVQPYADAPSFSAPLGHTTMFVGYPVLDEEGRSLGVLAGRVRLEPMETILSDKSGLGSTGETYLVGNNRLVLAGLGSDSQGLQVETQGVQQAVVALESGSGIAGSSTYRNYADTQVIGAYTWMEDFQAFLFAEQARLESLRLTYAVLAVNASVAVASILIALFIALMVTYTIAQPVTELAERAGRIAGGDLPESERPLPDEPRRQRTSAEVEAEIQTQLAEREDELGTLARAFDKMTNQLLELIGSLEQRVAERTRALEIRSNYLEASAQVSRAATSILDPNELIKQAVELIRQRFDLYYVGLFLADERNEWAILRAGTGEAGQAMMDRAHRLPIGQASMIGWAIANAQARIAQEAAADMVRVAMPELPETRSEAAIPLRTRGRVLGAISVQSDQPNAFDEVALSALQSLVDQLAVAIDNARLFAESREALEAERRAYAEQTQAAWQDWFAGEPQQSIVGDLYGITHRQAIWRPEMLEARDSGVTTFSAPSEGVNAPRSTNLRPDALRPQSGSPPPRVAIPITVRGNVIGVIDVSKSERTQSWSSEEVTLLEDIAGQLGVALDSARLYAETRQRAEQERTLSEIAAQMRATLNVEAVLKTAVEEIYEAMNLDQVVIQLTPGPTAESKASQG